MAQALDDLKTSKLDKELNLSTGPKLLIQKQNMRDQINFGNLSVKPQFIRPKMAAIESLKMQTTQPIT